MQAHPAQSNSPFKQSQMHNDDPLGPGQQPGVLVLSLNIRNSAKEVEGEMDLATPGISLDKSWIFRPSV